MIFRTEILKITTEKVYTEKVTFLKYPARITLCERFGSKKEKSRFISSIRKSKQLMRPGEINIKLIFFASITIKEEEKRKDTSSSSTKVLRITSISQVKTSEEMKGNLIEKHDLRSAVHLDRFQTV